MTAKERREKRRERYGMVKIRPGQKMAWISEQNRHGWSLGLALNERTIWLRNTRFARKEDVVRALGSEATNCVFIPLKGNA